MNLVRGAVASTLSPPLAPVLGSERPGAQGKAAAACARTGSGRQPRRVGPALASQPILGKAATAAAAPYVQAVSQRAGMRGTLCSALWPRADERAGPGARRA